MEGATLREVECGSILFCFRRDCRRGEMEGPMNLLQHSLSYRVEQVAEGVSVQEKVGERIPQGLKPDVDCVAFAARLKSCPCYKALRFCAEEEFLPQRVKAALSCGVIAWRAGLLRFCSNARSLYFSAFPVSAAAGLAAGVSSCWECFRAFRESSSACWLSSWAVR